MAAIMQGIGAAIALSSWSSFDSKGFQLPSVKYSTERKVTSFVVRSDGRPIPASNLRACDASRRLVCNAVVAESPMAPSKILIIGGTGYIGKFIVEASAKSDHPTFALVRETTAPSGTEKAVLLESFQKSGVTLVQGDLNDHDSLVKAIKQVDVVISTVGKGLVQEQVKIIAAIKEAGNVKRFFPSEFGNDVDRTHAVDPALATYKIKARIRRAVESEGIPYTLVVCNTFAGYFLRSFAQPGATAPPREKVAILGEGNIKAIINAEEDVGTYTIKAVDDPRTLNKIMYINPPGNIYSFDELVSLWEKKIGKTLEKVYVPEEQLLKKIEAAPHPTNLVMSLAHGILVKGDQTNFEIDPSFGVEAPKLYPEVEYTSVDAYLNKFV